MGTGCAAIAVKHMGMKICGISCITNMAASIFDQPLNHKGVQEGGRPGATAVQASGDSGD